MEVLCGDDASCISTGRRTSRVDHDGVCLISSRSDGRTRWEFEERVVIGSRVEDRSFHNRITGCGSLAKQGLYCTGIKAWRRYFLTRTTGCAVRLYEDVTESGGQNSLWGAGLVMADYIESNLSAELREKRVLELGAGAGVAGMVVAATCEAVKVVCTEQPTCMRYLERNLAMNPHLSTHVDARTLYWTTNAQQMPREEQFDCVLACDVTYDPSLFTSLLATMKSHLRPEDTAFALICHDNDSCPLSPRAEAELSVRCKEQGFTFTPISLRGVVTETFYEKTMRMWRLTHAHPLTS